MANRVYVLRSLGEQPQAYFYSLTEADDVATYVSAKVSHAVLLETRLESEVDADDYSAPALHTAVYVGGERAGGLLGPLGLYVATCVECDEPFEVHVEGSDTCPECADFLAEQAAMREEERSRQWEDACELVADDE